MPHIHEKIDFTVEVFIVYKNKVLLRIHDKYKIWLSVGGHIELDEDPNQAALREVIEEVGLKVELYKDPNLNLISNNERYSELIPPIFMSRMNITDTHEHVVLTYFAKSNTDKLIISKSEKTEGCRWFTMEELDNPKYRIKDTIKNYAKRALETLKY